MRRRAGQGHGNAEPSAYEPRREPGSVADGSDGRSLTEHRGRHAADPDASTRSLAVIPALDVTGADFRAACPRAGGARWA